MDGGTTRHFAHGQREHADHAGQKIMIEGREDRPVDEEAEKRIVTPELGA
jgi:hypothetical protein